MNCGMEEPRRMLVTGGNGFLGSRLVRLLCAEGWTVRCLLRRSSRTGRIDDLPVERVIGDVRDPQSLEAATAGCRGVMHLASLASWELIASPLLHAVVVEGTRNVLRAAQAAGNLRTVVMSSAAAINGTDHPVVQDETAPFTLDPREFSYAAAKRQAEQLTAGVVAEGLPAVIVNPAEIYGPDDTDFVTSGNLRQWIRSRPAMVLQGGTGIVHVDDVATAVLAAWRRGRVGERYFLGGENLTLKALAELTLELAGHPRRPVMVLPNGLVKRAAALAGRSRMPFPVPPAMIPYATKYWFFTAAKAERELGVQFRPAAEVLEPTIEWLQKRTKVG